MIELDKPEHRSLSQTFLLKTSRKGRETVYGIIGYLSPDYSHLAGSPKAGPRTASDAAAALDIGVSVDLLHIGPDLPHRLRPVPDRGDF